MIGYLKDNADWDTWSDGYENGVVINFEYETFSVQLEEQELRAMLKALKESKEGQ